MPAAQSRHILVDTEEKCADLKEKIADGADFAGIAKPHQIP